MEAMVNSRMETRGRFPIASDLALRPIAGWNPLLSCRRAKGMARWFTQSMKSISIFRYRAIHVWRSGHGAIAIQMGNAGARKKDMTSHDVNANPRGFCSSCPS